MQAVADARLEQPLAGLRDQLQLVHLIADQSLARHVRQEAVPVAVRLELQQLLMGLQAQRPIDTKYLSEEIAEYVTEKRKRSNLI